MDTPPAKEAATSNRLPGGACVARLSRSALLAAACLLSSAAENPAASPSRTTSFSTRKQPSSVVVVRTLRVRSLKNLVSQRVYPLSSVLPRSNAARRTRRLRCSRLSVARCLVGPALARGPIPTTSASKPSASPPQSAKKPLCWLSLFTSHIRPLVDCLALTSSSFVSHVRVLTRAARSVFLQVQRLSVSIQLGPH